MEVEVWGQCSACFAVPQMFLFLLLVREPLDLLENNFLLLEFLLLITLHCDRRGLLWDSGYKSISAHKWLKLKELGVLCNDTNCEQPRNFIGSLLVYDLLFIAQKCIPLLRPLLYSIGELESGSV